MNAVFGTTFTAKCPKWPADRLAKLSGQAGEALKREWKL